MIRTPLLESPATRHGFFTREGGVSGGIFASLNCSLGSGDAPSNVEENRRRVLAQLGLPPGGLVTCHQVHGSDVVVVDEPWSQPERPRADAMVTRRKGLALGILTADCAPVLFADAEAGIVAAAHAGWRGALAGVIAATVAAMRREGAELTRIRAVIGPCIGFQSYEVGPEFPAPFLAQSASNAAFFRDASRAGHYLFDLAGFVRARLAAAGIAHIDATGGDTAAEAGRFFSYRRSCVAGERQFGHELSAICLAP
ncbi:MAG TPA: peptidoglycan editing factor PgeF [Stellaceae bacterium]|nr:peptidoglycan editing factor PgeF [Stellaceae bacterium]